MYLQESPELRVAITFVFYSLFGRRKLSNIKRIRQTEFGSRFKEYVSNSLNYRRLLTLPYIQHFQKTTVAFAQIKNVCEDLFDEILEFTLPDDRRVSPAQRFDEELAEVN